MTFHILVTLVPVLVVSKVDYSNALYLGLPLRLAQKLQQVLNAMARLESDVSEFNHISLALAHLHWLPAVFCARFKVLVLIYQVLFLHSINTCNLLFTGLASLGVATARG